MKRPLTVVTFLYFAVLAFSVCLLPVVNLTLFVMVTILGIVTIFIQRHNRRTVTLLLAPVALGFLVMWHCQSVNAQTTAILQGNACTVTGEVTDMPRCRDGRWYYVLQTERIDLPDAPQRIKIRLSCRNSLEAREGDRVTASVTFLTHDSETGYDSSTALLADGIQMKAWCSPYAECSIEHRDGGLRYFPLTVRRHMMSGIHRALPSKSAGMLCAMLLGEADELDDSIAEHFRATGIAHLLAVSGLHLTLLTGVLTWVLLHLHSPFRIRMTVTVLFVAFFMAVTGFTPSVTRAGIMYLLALAAPLLLRETDSLTSLSAAILVMLLINPMSAADVGLQLSAAATVGLILFAAPLTTAIHKRLPETSEKWPSFLLWLRNGAVSTLSASLIASCFTLPLCALHFGRISLVAPVTNLLCVYAATLFLLIGILAALLYAIPLVGFLLSFPLRLTATLLCAYLDKTTHLLTDIPLSSVNASYGYVPWFLLFAAAMVLVGYVTAKREGTEAFRRYAMRCVFCGISLLLLVSMGSYAIADADGKITVLAIQDGGVCIIARNGGRAMVAEAGGDSYDRRAVQTYLSEWGVQRIDALSISKKSDPRSSNADRLIEALSPNRFFCGDDLTKFPLAKQAAERQNIDILPFDGTVRVHDPPLSMEMLTDAGGQHWQRLQSGQLTVLLCPDQGDCALLPVTCRECDVAVIGSLPQNITLLHTGAVIITSEYREAAQTASRLQVKGFRHIYLTARDGNVTCAMIDGNLHIATDIR